MDLLFDLFLVRGQALDQLVGLLNVLQPCLQSIQQNCDESQRVAAEAKVSDSYAVAHPVEVQGCSVEDQLRQVGVVEMQELE